MIGNYTNQSLTLKHVASVNQYNESTYTTTAIKGRKEAGNKLVRSSTGQEVVSAASVFTESLVCNGDLIDNSLVVTVDSAVDLGGEIRFYKAWLT